MTSGVDVAVAVGGSRVGVKVNVGVSVTGPNGVGGARLGSTVARLKGAENGTVGAAVGAVGIPHEERTKEERMKRLRALNVKRLTFNVLVGVLEIFIHQIRKVRIRVGAQDAEEIVGSGDLAALLGKVILDEGEEGLVADARAHVL